MKKWIVALFVLASVVGTVTVGALALTIAKQDQRLAALQEQLDASREQTVKARKAERETQEDIAKLLKRQRQLTKFIRSLGLEPPPPDSSSGSPPPSNEPPSEKPGPRPKPKPKPTEPPPPEECIAEVLGTCV